MASKTIEQQLAELEAKKARLLQRSRKQENGQKIILGGLLLAAAKQDGNMRNWVIDQIGKQTREADKVRLAPLLVELQAMK